MLDVVEFRLRNGVGFDELTGALKIMLCELEGFQGDTF